MTTVQRPATHVEAAHTSPCTACNGTRIAAQVCNSVFLLPAQPIALPQMMSGARIHALICVRCGQITLYAKDPGPSTPSVDLAD
jgi:hypothetical protein